MPVDINVGGLEVVAFSDEELYGFFEKAANTHNLYEIMKDPVHGDITLAVGSPPKPVLDTGSKVKTYHTKMGKVYQTVLGCMMDRNPRFRDVREVLRPDGKMADIHFTIEEWVGGKPYDRQYIIFAQSLGKTKNSAGLDVMKTKMKNQPGSVGIMAIMQDPKPKSDSIKRFTHVRAKNRKSGKIEEMDNLAKLTGLELFKWLSNGDPNLYYQFKAAANRWGSKYYNKILQTFGPEIYEVFKQDHNG